MKTVCLITLVMAQCLWMAENASTTTVVGTSSKPHGTTASPGGSVQTRAPPTGQPRGSTSSSLGGSVATYPPSDRGAATANPVKYSVKTGSSVVTVKPTGSTASTMMSPFTRRPMGRGMATARLNTMKSGMDNMVRRMTTSSGTAAGTGRSTGRNSPVGMRMPKGMRMPVCSGMQTRRPFTMITRMPQMGKRMTTNTLMPTGSGVSAGGRMAKAGGMGMGRGMFSRMQQMMNRYMSHLRGGMPTSSGMSKGSMRPTRRPMMTTAMPDMGRRMSTSSGMAGRRGMARMISRMSARMSNMMGRMTTGPGMSTPNGMSPGLGMSTGKPTISASGTSVPTLGSGQTTPQP